MNVNEIKAKSNVDSLEAKVVSKEEEREFNSFRGSGRVCNIMVEDDTGKVKISLWNEQIDEINEGDTILLENGWAKEYKGELQLSTGKAGTLKVVGKEDTE
ncbi:MAG: DNA-binding protein [Candidatus Altiarchaeales archaeon HGW-Altiarchaeales-3]|nr:MAG: DNA-binding protein [Candidatus Altiarchaeales archaeon HGW-Altiarchaeales-3]